MKGSDLLAGAAKAATYNMLLQFSLRIMTFLLNAFVLRFITRDMLGVVNVRLTLLYSTTLFLAKEAFDKACLSKSEHKNWQQIINLLWCTFPVAIVCCSLLSFVWLYMVDVPDTQLIPYYNIGVICFAISTVIEVIAEPLVIVGQAFMFVKLKVLFYGISQGVKCLLTVILIIYSPDLGIINFCIAQIISVLVYVVLYYGYFINNMSKVKKTDDFPFKSVGDFLPKKLKDKPSIDSHYASLTWSFFKQSFLKQLLTEGEKFVMTFFKVLSFADQGIYDVINNLGSMAARFIFLPIEENGYLFFSQSLTRGVAIHKQKKESVELCCDVLRSL
ncbi:protein RFT1 homolog [Patella vulgata]|uniref:protein RFT1 homolog n=1 Tax=Patella vulgata TaxID=6465 RepID=UPI0021803C18|nr:protein RFT1 homolog [Patella vulgata]